MTSSMVGLSFGSIFNMRFTRPHRDREKGNCHDCKLTNVFWAVKLVDFKKNSDTGSRLKCNKTHKYAEDADPALPCSHEPG